MNHSSVAAQAAGAPDGDNAFEVETDQLVASRVRFSALVAVPCLLAFVPLDWFRDPESFWFASMVRLGGVAVLAIVSLAAVRVEPARSHWLAAATVAVVAGVILTAIPFADGVNDIVYFTQSVGVVILIMAVGVFIPLDGRRIAVVVTLPLVMHVLATLHMPALENASVLTADLIAWAIAVFGADRAYQVRRRAFAGQAAREALLDARSEFAAMLTHDIKSPLAVISGYVEMCREHEDLPEDLGALLTGIEAASRRAFILTTNFLEASRIENDRFVVRKKATQVVELVELVVSQQRCLADLKNIRLEQKASSELPVVFVDPALVERGLTNLVSNAVRHTADGGNVIVSALNGGNVLRLLVEDDGEGLPPELVDKVFHRFTGGAHRTDSTGLGLFIVKTIAEAHGGSVGASNRSEGGACFEMTLPLESPPNAS